MWQTLQQQQQQHLHRQEYLNAMAHQYAKSRFVRHTHHHHNFYTGENWNGSNNNMSNTTGEFSDYCDRNCNDYNQDVRRYENQQQQQQYNLQQQQNTGVVDQRHQYSRQIDKVDISGVDKERQFVDDCDIVGIKDECDFQDQQQEPVFDDSSDINNATTASSGFSAR